MLYLETSFDSCKNRS